MPVIFPVIAAGVALLGAVLTMVDQQEEKAIIQAKLEAKAQVEAELKKSGWQFVRAQLRSHFFDIVFLLLVLLGTYFLPRNYAIIAVALAYFYIFGLFWRGIYRLTRRFFPLLKQQRFKLWQAVEIYLYDQIYQKVLPRVQAAKNTPWDYFSTSNAQDITEEIATEAAKHGKLLIKQGLKRFLWLFLSLSAFFFFFRRALPQLVGNVDEMSLMDILLYPFIQLWALVFGF